MVIIYPICILYDSPICKVINSITLHFSLLSGLIFLLEASLMSTVYEEQKDEDGFLYVQYSGESTFGN